MRKLAGQRLGQVGKTARRGVRRARSVAARLGVFKFTAGLFVAVATAILVPVILGILADDEGAPLPDTIEIRDFTATLIDDCSVSLQWGTGGSPIGQITLMRDQIAIEVFDVGPASFEDDLRTVPSRPGDTDVTYQVVAETRPNDLTGESNRTESKPMSISLMDVSC